MKTINFCVVDDDISFIELLKKQLEIISQELHFLYTIECYNSSVSFNIDKKYDVYLLDIDMPDISGFNLAEKINLRYKDSYIVFISSIETLVYNSLDYHPFDYIYKKSLNKKLKITLKSILDRLSPCFYNCKVEKNYVQLSINNIVYVEKHLNYCILTYISRNYLSKVKQEYYNLINK